MHTHNTERTTQRDENWGKSFKALSLNFWFAAAPPYRHFFIHPPDPHFPQFFVAYHLAIWGDYLDLDTQNIQEVSSIWC